VTVVACFVVNQPVDNLPGVHRRTARNLIGRLAESGTLDEMRRTGAGPVSGCNWGQIVGPFSRSGASGIARDYLRSADKWFCEDDG
jgi:hypothetical protein